MLVTQALRRFVYRFSRIYINVDLTYLAVLTVWTIVNWLLVLFSSASRRRIGVSH